MWKVGQLQAKLVAKNIAVRTEDCVQFHYKVHVKNYFITCTPLCSTRFALDDCSFYLHNFQPKNCLKMQCKECRQHCQSLLNRRICYFP